MQLQRLQPADLIKQFHADSSARLSLQDAVRTAQPGVVSKVLPVVQLFLHLLHDPAVPRLVSHVVPLLGILLPIKELPLRSEVIFV